MSNNVVVTAGTGTTIAADELTDADLGSVKVQYVKIMDGTLDGSDKAAVDATAGLKVNLGADNDVTVTGTVDLGATDNAVLDAIEADTTTIAGAVSGSEMQVDVITSVLPSGASTLVEQQTQTTSLQLIDDIIATDDTSTHTTAVTKGALIMAAATPTDGSVNANDLGAVAMTLDRKLHVAVMDSLPAGTNGIGKLTANSGVDIGDVDVLSIAAGDNNIGNVDIVTMPAVTATQLDVDNLNPTDDIVAIGDGTSTATVRNLAANDALNVAIVDGSGDQITSFGGGTQYTEDAAAAANPTGTAPILVRTDTPATQVTTDGDNIAQRGTNYGAAYVQLVNSSGSYIDSVGGGTEYTEDVATANPIVGKAIMVERDDALTTVTPVEGDNIGLRGTAEGALWTQDFNSDAILADTTNIDTATAAINAKMVSGTDIGDVTINNASGASAVNIQDGGNTITVDGTVAVTGVSTLAEQQTQTTHLSTMAGDTTSIQTAVELLDDTVATDGAATPTKGILIAGQDGTNAQTISTNATGHINIADGGNTITVDGTVAVSGTVAVTQSGTWDEVGINDSGNSITVDYATTGSGTATGALRVELPTNGTGVVGLNAGTNNIGDVDIASIAAGDNNIGNVDIVSGTITTVSTVTAMGAGTTGPMKAEDVAHATGDQGFAVWGVSNEANTARAADSDYIPFATDTEGNQRIVGNRDHDAVDAGEVVSVGGVAVSGSATPTSVASGDRTRRIFNQHGIPYVMAGHPNLITREYDFGTTAQTDVNLAAALVAADERIYVTRFEATCDNANSVAVSVRAGFGTASVPTASATGVSGMIGSHPGLAAGSGIVSGNGAGIIAVGGAGEEPRITTSAATSGNLHVLISYYLIDETP